MKPHVIAIAGFTTLSAANAHADPCAHVSKKVADAGAKTIKASTEHGELLSAVW